MIVIDYRMLHRFLTKHSHRPILNLNMDMETLVTQWLKKILKDQLTPEEIRNELITVLFDGVSPKPPNFEGNSIRHDDEAFRDMLKSALRIYAPGLSEPIADLLWEDERIRAPLQMILYEIQHYPNLMRYKSVTVEERS